MHASEAKATTRLHGTCHSRASPIRRAPIFQAGGWGFVARCSRGVVLAFALCALSTPVESGVHATDGSHELFCNSSVREQSWKLFSTTDRGHNQFERAAFVMQDENGHYVFSRFVEGESPWRITFSGEIPPGTLAIFHTHPAGRPHPSASDTQTSRQTGLPVYVLTMWHVFKTDGTGIESVWNGHWGDSRRKTNPRGSPCKVAAAE